MLGTHDIQNISVSSPLRGQVRVTGDFIQGSTATGALIITISDKHNIQYNLCPRNGDKKEVRDTISGLAGGTYKVSIFVVEENKLPTNRTAVMPRNLSVLNGKYIILHEYMYK